jgi:hypothetical protein
MHQHVTRACIDQMYKQNVCTCMYAPACNTCMYQQNVCTCMSALACVPLHLHTILHILLLHVVYTCDRHMHCIHFMVYMSIDTFIVYMSVHSFNVFIHCIHSLYTCRHFIHVTFQPWNFSLSVGSAARLACFSWRKKPEAGLKQTDMYEIIHVILHI